MLVLFTVTIFLSAALLFVVEPMFARMALPLLGGSPSVWNTALVFYQAMLLLGYLYAHALSRLKARRQAEMHALVLLLPVLVLPIAVSRLGAPPPGANPVPWFLALLLTAVGLPFFVVATTGSLLQHWFVRSGHAEGRDPYFLYAASNLGSFLGLLAYPLVVEPALTLRAQSLGWTAGYALLAVLVLACAWVALTGPNRGRAPLAEPTAAPTEAARPIDRARKLRWVAWAFVPSSLLMGVTTHITLDVGSMPLLWVLPLAVYLLTFTVAFGRRVLVPRSFLLRAMPFAVTVLTVVLAARASEPFAFILGLDLLVLAVMGLLFHGLLAQDRPDPRHLTGFYLWVAFGGVLGGAFNALLSPVLFHSVLEYPLVIVLACLLAPPRGGEARPRPNGLDFVLPLALLGLTLGAVAIVHQPALARSRFGIFLAFAWPAFVAFTFSRRPLRFALGTAAVLLAGNMVYFGAGHMLREERNFFGILRVFASPGGKHVLFHGATIHGVQWIDPAKHDIPLSYYTREGPFGSLFASQRARMHGAPLRVGLVGLGAGALALYAQPGDTWTAYEIDPDVDRIARDRAWFTYLADARAPVTTVLGDARLSLARAPDARFDVLVLDAYSSDAIPVHLLTREAVRLYLARLAPGGVIVFHLSNRHLDLRPVVTGIAKDLELAALLCDDLHVSAPQQSLGRFPARVMVVARSARDFGDLAARDPRWVVLPARTDLRLWTDDYSSILPLYWANETFPSSGP